MFGAPSTPKSSRMSSWSRYMTTPTSSTIPTDSVSSTQLSSSAPNNKDTFQANPSSTTPQHYPTFFNTRPSDSHSPSLSDSPYTGREDKHHSPYADRYPPPHSIQQQLDHPPLTPPRTSPMPYPTTPSPQYGISGSLIVSEPQVIRTDSSCNPISNDVFGTASNPKSRPALRPNFSHNGNGVYTQLPSTWPRRMMPPTESNERTRSSTAYTNMSPPPAPPSLIASTAPAGSTYAAPPPPRNESAQGGSAKLQVHADQAQAQGHGHASAQPHGFGSSLPASLPSNIHHPSSSSFAAPPPPSFATQQPGSHHTSYSDDPAYPTSQYDSIPTYSPWPAHSSLPSHSDLHVQRPPPGYGYPPPTFWTQPLTKMDEPILAPGELPAPRPPMSYAALIGEALLCAAAPHQLYVSEISDSIKRRYTYYRQNPSKVYNGVRHQTSMCKAFVKLPRPYGDQSGGARKWAIRAGCEAWFHSGGYHPPSSSASPVPSHATVKKSASTGGAAGKAKSTARAKQLAIGTTSPEELPRRRLPHEPYSPSSGQGGPSIGAAFDGSGRPTWTQTAPPQWVQPGPGPGPSVPTYTLPHPSQAGHAQHAPPPGMAPYPYHYVSVQQQQHHHQQAHPQHPQYQGQPMYVPVYNNHPGHPYQHHPHHHQQSPGPQYMPTPVSQAGGQHQQQQGPGSQGSEDWRYENEAKGEQQQGQAQDQDYHSSPESVTSHHSG